MQLKNCPFSHGQPVLFKFRNFNIQFLTFNHKVMNTKTASLVLGLIFIAVGLLGFISNPIIGPDADAIFHANTTHNMVHIVSGVLFVLVALARPGDAGRFLKIFGVIYFALGVLGVLSIGSSGMTTLLGFLHVNGADNYLHIALGLVIFLAGFLPGRKIDVG
jgi:hypothetical protein